MKIEGRHDIFKNPNTGVVHYNINKHEMESIRAAKRKKQNEVETLKKDVAEMKDMLKSIMEKL